MTKIGKVFQTVLLLIIIGLQFILQMTTTKNNVEIISYLVKFKGLVDLYLLTNLTIANLFGMENVLPILKMEK